MTDPITLAFAVAYAVSVIVLVVWLRRFPSELRQYCYPILGLVVLAAVTHTLSGFGLGVVPTGEGSVDIPNVVDGAIGYGVLFGFAAYLAGVGRRALAVAAVLPAGMNFSFQVAAVGDGIVAIAGALVVVLGYPVLCWLYARPFAQTVSGKTAARQRLYRKFRNLLLFLIGALIVTAFTTLDVFHPDVSGILTSYVDFLLRVGFTGFLFANVDVFGEFE